MDINKIMQDAQKQLLEAQRQVKQAELRVQQAQKQAQEAEKMIQQATEQAAAAQHAAHGSITNIVVENGIGTFSGGEVTFNNCGNGIGTLSGGQMTINNSGNGKSTSSHTMVGSAILRDGRSLKITYDGVFHGEKCLYSLKGQRINSVACSPDGVEINGIMVVKSNV